MGYLQLTRSDSFRPAPLFGDLLQGDPYVFDFSADNPRVADYASSDFDRFQRQIFDELEASKCSWGLGHYLEERATLLRPFPQMIDEGRVIHAGLDVIVPEGVPLFAPLGGTVHACGLDDGVGNYGGYVVLRHEPGRDHEDEEPFYSFYGHVQTDFEVAPGQLIERGASFARIGAHRDSGQWFTHTHLQIHNQASIDEGRLMQGYITREDLARVGDLFPTPYPMFRVDP